MIKGIQIIGILVGLYLIAQTLINYKQGNYGPRKTIFWIALWSTMAALFLKTDIMRFLLPILTTEDAIMSVLVMGVLTSLILISQQYQQAARIERRLTELIQNLAIRDYIEETSHALRKEDE